MNGDAGKNKMYYAVKDINFLQHEPLLTKFREMKIWLRKKTTAEAKRVSEEE